MPRRKVEKFPASSVFRVHTFSLAPVLCPITIYSPLRFSTMFEKNYQIEALCLFVDMHKIMIQVYQTGETISYSTLPNGKAITQFSISTLLFLLSPSTFKSTASWIESMHKAHLKCLLMQNHFMLSQPSLLPQSFSYGFNRYSGSTLYMLEAKIQSLKHISLCPQWLISHSWSDR